MLQEMLGQHAHDACHRQPACSRRFGIEFAINLATTFTWTPDGDVGARVRRRAEPGVCDNARVLPLQRKECAEAKDRDYADEVAGVVG